MGLLKKLIGKKPSSERAKQMKSEIVQKKKEATRLPKPTKLDSRLKEAVKTAYIVALQTADSIDQVGKQERFDQIDNTVGIHYFGANITGYKGWKWAVILSLLPENDDVSVLECVLVASDESIVAPPWIPFSERLKPSDISETDELPYEPDDDRLETLKQLKQANTEELDNIVVQANRMLSTYGKEDVAARWYEGTHGPSTGSTRIAQAQCMSCAFFIGLAGDLGQLFGVCANSWSRDDGRVVSLDHGCGMHSETDVSHKGNRWREQGDLALDEITQVEDLNK